jgi:amino acid permease
MEKGSVRGSIFVLLACAIGAGMLGLPAMYLKSGFLAGLMFTVNGGIIAYLSLSTLSFCADKTQATSYS